MTRYYRDAAGNYLGGFDGAAPPLGAIEVSVPPANARMKWDGARWSFTAQDLDQLKTNEANASLNIKAFRALTEVTFNLIKNPSLYTTLAEYRIAVRDQYKNLNGQ